MFFDAKVNTSIGVQGNQGYLDYLKDCLVSAGWVVDKQVTRPLYEKGRGLCYPAEFPNSGSRNVSYDITRTTFLKSAYIVNHWGITTFYSINGFTPSLQTLTNASHTLPAIQPNSSGSLGMLVDPILNTTPFTLMMGAGAASSCTHRVHLAASAKYENTTVLVDKTFGGDSAIVEMGANLTLPDTTKLYLFGQNLTSIPYANWLQCWVNLTEPNWIDTGTTWTYELYVHSNNNYGETIYVSFLINTDEDMLYMYTNTGFNTNNTVDNQPGTVSSTDLLSKDYGYMYITFPYYDFWSQSLTFVGDNNGFTFNMESDLKGKTERFNQHFVVSSIKKHFLYNGGIYTYSSNYKNSPYYILYEGAWYGNSISTSVTNKQGYNDLLTPSTYTTAPSNTYTGYIYLVEHVAGVNLTITNNGEYKPLGIIDNVFKHYGGTPKTNLKFSQGPNTYLSIYTGTSTRVAFKIQ